MATLIGKLRGLSYELEIKLRERGIRTSDQLLDAARTPAGRKELAAYAGVEARAILELVNRADLARVKGIGGVFSDLLEHAGVDTVEELATRRPDNLYARLVEINAQERLAGRAPTRNAVQAWVAYAKELPPLLEY
jgi:predicted flap endonuclease-1-like 5' DNA nuclease